MIMSKCKGLIGLIFGHKFKAIITKSAAKIPANASSVGSDFAETLRDEQYHGIVCLRCGEKHNV